MNILEYYNFKNTYGDMFSKRMLRRRLDGSSSTLSEAVTVTTAGTESATTIVGITTAVSEENPVTVSVTVADCVTVWVSVSVLVSTIVENSTAVEV